MRLARSLLRIEESLALEFILCACVIAVAVAFLVPAGETATMKAKASKLVSHFGSDKPALMVEMAFTGETTVVAAPPEFSRKAGESYYGAPAVERHVEHGGVRYEVALDKNGRSYSLSFAPAVPLQGAGWSMLWLCGDQKAPPGWVLPSMPASGLPPEMIPSACQNRGMP